MADYVRRKAFPTSTRVGILYNPAEPATVLEMKETEAYGVDLGCAGGNND